MGLLSRRRSAFYLVIVNEDGSGLDILSHSDAEAEAHPDVLVAVVVMTFDLLMPIFFKWAFPGNLFEFIFLLFLVHCFRFTIDKFDCERKSPTTSVNKPSLSQDSNPARSDRMALLYHLRHHCSL